MLVFGALLVGVTVFVLALHRPHPSELANIKETTDGWWMHQAMPTPQLTPRVLPSPQSRPVLMVQAPPRPAPQPTPKPLSEEELRYRRAIEIGMGADTNTVRQLPQVINTNGKPSATPMPNIFALGAYPQP
jgi:hypothetical protein